MKSKEIVHQACVHGWPFKLSKTTMQGDSELSYVFAIFQAINKAEASQKE